MVLTKSVVHASRRSEPLALRLNNVLIPSVDLTGSTRFFDDLNLT